MTGFESKRQMAQAKQEPTPWRDMVVVTLVREGINKHKARELADHFAAQPEQEPCIGKDPRCPCQDGDACHYKDCGNTKARPPVQPEQEPVAKLFGTLPVYDTPPAAQRQWVGLTDEEKKTLATAAGCTDDDDGHIVTEIFRLAEAKLKERNT
jgi:hypothetical protein